MFRWLHRNPSNGETELSILRTIVNPKAVDIDLVGFEHQYRSLRVTNIFLDEKASVYTASILLKSQNNDNLVVHNLVFSTA